MSINAAEVNKLRKRTNAGIMDCKNALIQSEGDFEKAVDILRKKGQKISTKRADKDILEGSVFANTNENLTFGVIIALSCETDFVAKNDMFVELGNQIIDVATKHTPDSIEDVLNLSIDNVTVNEKLTDLMGKIGEKVQITNFQKLESNLVVSYIHNGNNLAVLIGMDGTDKKSYQAVEAAKNVSMQIAAMNPLALSKDSIDPQILAREMEIAKEQANMQGKPESVTQKIAEGKVAKFLKENTLLDQAYLKDQGLTVDQYVKTINKEIDIVGYKRVSIK